MGDLNSTPVTLADLGGGVAQITMQDRESCNGLSRGFGENVRRCFTEVAGNPRWKVVILAGYEAYFCSGGTRDGLLQLQRGKARFNEYGSFHMALDCDIPVISAMQGHAVGGGLVFGLYSDLVVLGRESFYTANFMKYGFTPGLGATLILPQKLGGALAHEMMYTAHAYRGEDLSRRGVPWPVVPRKEVLGQARQLANQLAEKPRLALVTLKHHLTSELRSRLPGMIEHELRMHEITFHQPEVARIIEAEFAN
jgi:polyketide biosynthesis enoyl-CoA hydratase PksI